MNKPLTEQRIRIRFGKTGMLRFVGHLDLATTWERMFRRARLPLEYTQGFNPRPRLQIAAALQVGVTSECEYLDAWLTRRLGDDFPQGWVERLNATAPRDLPVYELYEVSIKGPSLPSMAYRAEYVLVSRDPEALNPGDLRERAAALLAQDEIMRSGHKKPYDLRPRIVDIQPHDEDQLVAVVSVSERANARIDEVLDAMGLSLEVVSAHRRQLILQEPNA